MTTVRYFADPTRTHVRPKAVILLDSRETCLVLFGQRGVCVRRPFFGHWGRQLYQEHDQAKITIMGLILEERYPKSLLPPGFADFHLSAFTNAVMHCYSCHEVVAMFHQMTHRPAGIWPPPPWWNNSWMCPSLTRKT